jgi:hypothetical protein
MRKTIRSVTAVAAVAALGVTGLTSVASAAPAGTEHISIVSTSATSSHESIILTGVFTAGGTDISGNSVDLVQLPLGTFKINHKGSDASKLNTKTCLQTIKGTGTYKLLDGTGLYKGLTGSGKYKLSISVVAERASGGKCSQNAAPLAYQFAVAAAGPVSIP